MPLKCNGYPKSIVLMFNPNLILPWIQIYPVYHVSNAMHHLFMYFGSVDFFPKACIKCFDLFGNFEGTNRGLFALVNT